MIHYQDRWAVVTGASSGLGRGIAARLADRGMSLVLTGRNEARLDEAAREIRRAAPLVKVETVVADISTRSGVSALLDHVGDRPIEVLVNNAGFGSYGPFAEADADREDDEVAVDVSAVITLARVVSSGNARSRKRRHPQRCVRDRIPARAVPGGVRGEQGIRAVVQPGVVGRGPRVRRRGYRIVSGSHPHGFRRRAGRRRRTHGDLQPARRTRARDRCWSPGTRQGPRRGHPRHAKQS